MPLMSAFSYEIASYFALLVLIGPRGFVGLGPMVGVHPGVRPMAPRGPMQLRPLMDFGEQLEWNSECP